MTIITVQFEYPESFHLPDYDALLRVFEASVRKQAPEAHFRAIRIPCPGRGDDEKALNFWYNTAKLEAWVRALEETDDNVILADCDMLMARPFPDPSVFDEDFDVAYTERTKEVIRFDKASVKYWGNAPIRRMPMNGGIMLAKPTPAARQFFRLLLETNERLYRDTEEHMKWNVKYAGMNQAAFGCLFESGEFEAKVVPLSCRIWNAVDCDWHAVENTSVFIHIKSKLRKLVLARQRPYGNFKPAMSAWYDVARECGVPSFERIP